MERASVETKAFFPEELGETFKSGIRKYRERELSTEVVIGAIKQITLPGTARSSLSLFLFTE